MQINPKRLRKRLQWLAWEGGLTRVTLYGVSDTHSAHKLLRAYKSLISCVQVTHPDTQAPVHIILYGWPLTDSVFRALKSLPQWCKVEGSTLDLCACTWCDDPLQYQEYVAEYVPCAFTKWVLGDPPSSVLLSICAGLNKRCESQPESAQRPTLIVTGHSCPDVTIGRVTITKQ